MPSALDLNVEELARQAAEARQAERYVPASGAVAPMYPNPPGLYTAGDPNDYQGPPEARRPGDTYSGPPEPYPRNISYQGPPEAARPGDTYSGPPEARRPGDTYSGPPEARRPGDTYSGPPEPARPFSTESYEGPPEPPRPGDTYSGPPERPPARVSALDPDKGAAGLEPVDPRFQPPGPIEGWLRKQVGADKKPKMPDGPASEIGPTNFYSDLEGQRAKALGTSAMTVTSAPGGDKPGAAAPVKPTAAPAKRQLQGAPAASATEGDKPVPMTPRQSISPRAYVDLEQTNPGLYKAITSAAATVDVGAWDLTNVMMAASRGDAGYNASGRVGLTGLTQADIERYRVSHPELFQDPQGRPIDPSEPMTNLLLGALKLKDMYDRFGTRTDGALTAYFEGADRTNAAARMTEKDRAQHISEGTKTAVAQVKSGSATPPDKAPTPAVTGTGTGTPQGYAQAAVQAAKAGEPQIFARYAIQAAHPGTSTTDLWRSAQNSLMDAFLSKGNIEGATRAREMIFQLSQAGTTQELMKAHAALQTGDLAGSATHLARAYFYAPDGGQADFTVTSNGIYGQRHNEHDGSPVGGPFRVTPEGILSMLNVTQDPQAYAKHIREEQKALAEIADKKSLVRWRDVTQPAIAAGHDATRVLTNQQTNERAAAVAAANREAATERVLQQQGGANAREVHRAQSSYDQAMDVAGLRASGATKGMPTDKQINDELGQDMLGAGIATPQAVTPAFSNYGTYYGGLRRGGVDRPTAQSIANGIQSKQLAISAPLADGRIAVVNPRDPTKAITYLPPGTLARIQGGAPAAPPPPAAAGG